MKREPGGDIDPARPRRRQSLWFVATCAFGIVVATTVILAAIGLLPLVSDLGYAVLLSVFQGRGQETHYRLTTVVHTPSGDRTGSTVFGIRSKKIVNIAGAGGDSVGRWRGSGAEIVLPNGMRVIQSVKDGSPGALHGGKIRAVVPCGQDDSIEYVFRGESIVGSIGCHLASSGILMGYSVERIIERTSDPITQDIYADNIPYSFAYDAMNEYGAIRHRIYRERFYPREF